MRRGFTLIELLIVVFIITILAAILFPVFASARDKARQATCLSNVQQLGMALHLYAQEWQGEFPPKDNEWSPTLPYIKNTQLFRCPSDARATHSMPAYGFDSSVPAPPIPKGYASFSYRAGLANDGNALEVVAFDDRIRHNSGRNTVFLDGHAKWFRDTMFWQMASDRALAVDPAFQAMTPAQRKAAREGRPIPGRFLEEWDGPRI